MALLADLQSRGLVQQVSDLDLDAKLARLAAQRPIAAYVGFDPTSDSLHVGNFVPILALMYAQRHGILPIAIVGGATGLIGDPSGKSAERQLLTKEKVAQNVEGIRKVLERFLDFHDSKAPARIVNNLDWMGPMSAIDFLRNVGKHFRVGSMLAKDSVKGRMEGSEEGMSYTEFSYQILQAYDYYRLYKDYNCVLQMGGSDQWGNITAGTDLIRKLEGEGGNAFALTSPLITTSSGAKFGKSEGNAVWLTADRTSPFDFYQFWLRTEDADVERYLRLFTFLPIGEIQQIVIEHQKAPEKRMGQKVLAHEMTKLVHGQGAAEQAAATSGTLYGSGVEQLDAAAIEALAAQGVPTTAIDRARLEGGWSVIDATVETGLAKSKGDARRLIAGGGLYVNNRPVGDVNLLLKPADLVANAAIVLRSGKKNYRIARVG
jgi:tyrosyl-tRNA synthetase